MPPVDGKELPQFLGSSRRNITADLQIGWPRGGAAWPPFHVPRVGAPACGPSPSPRPRLVGGASSAADAPSCGASPQKAGLPHQFVKTLEVQPELDPLVVGFDGLDAQMEAGGNLARPQALAREAEDLQLAVGELLEARPVAAVGRAKVVHKCDRIDSLR